MNKVRGAVLDFAVNHMEPVLQKNDHKGGWEDMTPRQIMTRILQEVEELRKAIYRQDPEPDEMISEATDIANFCMMLVDNIQRSLPNPLDEVIASLETSEQPFYDGIRKLKEYRRQRGNQ